MDKPVSEEYKHPEWIWYGESTTGPIISLGRWAKYPNQKRYKIAETQATEHDHPSICVDDKPANRFYGEQRTKPEIGYHGHVHVNYNPDAGWMFSVSENNYRPDELREMAHFFNQMAEYLSDAY